MDNKADTQHLKTEAEWTKSAEEFNFSNQLLLNNERYMQIMPCRWKYWFRPVRFFLSWVFTLQIHMLPEIIYQKT